MTQKTSKNETAAITTLFALILGVGYLFFVQLFGAGQSTGLFQNQTAFLVSVIGIAVARLVNDVIVEVKLDGFGYIMSLVANIGLTMTLTVILVYFGINFVAFALGVAYLVETSLYGWLKDYLREEETESAARASTTRPKAA